MSNKKAMHNPSVYLCSLLAIARVSACRAGNSVVNTDDTNNNNTTQGSLINLSYFGANAFARTNIIDCELSDATTTRCYELVTVGTTEPIADRQYHLLCALSA